MPSTQTNLLADARRPPTCAPLANPHRPTAGRALACIAVLCLGCTGPAAAGADAAKDTTVDADSVSALDMAVAGADAPAPGEVAAAGAVGVPADATPGSACPVVGFEPCGGDVTGTWKVLRYCTDDPSGKSKPCQHPFDDKAACQGEGNGAVCDWYPERVLTFADDDVSIKLGGNLKSTWTFTDACLAVAKPGLAPAAACAALGNDKLACTAGPPCTCKGSVPLEESGTASGKWLKVGGTGLAISPGGGETWHMDYCVQGQVMVFDWQQHPQSWRYWVLRRE